MSPFRPLRKMKLWLHLDFSLHRFLPVYFKLFGPRTSSVATDSRASSSSLNDNFHLSNLMMPTVSFIWKAWSPGVDFFPSFPRYGRSQFPVRLSFIARSSSTPAARCPPHQKPVHLPLLMSADYPHAGLAIPFIITRSKEPDYSKHQPPSLYFELHYALSCFPFLNRLLDLSLLHPHLAPKPDRCPFRSSFFRPCSSTWMKLSTPRSGYRGFG